MKIRKILLIILAAIILASCGKNTSTTSKTEPLIVNTDLFYKPNGYADVIYVIKASYMTEKETMMIESLQGILAQTRASIFIEEKNNENSYDAEWFQEAKEKYNFRTVKISDPWSLVSIFEDQIKDKKYVLYNDCNDEDVSIYDQSINYATVVSACEHYLMIDKKEEQEAKDHGLMLGLDVTNNCDTELIFNTYKNQLNQSFLVHQSPSKRQLRDYAIAGKAMTFYSDFDNDPSVKESILTWANANAPILGWTENEVNFVSSNSLLSKITVAADWSTNLSFYSSLPSNSITQSNYEQRNITASQKHYVAIMMSDGDNVQWMQNGFASDSRFFGSSLKGEFPMTWTTSPSLYDLAPNILNHLYSNASARDQFIAGPSGVGYINPTEYNTQSIKEYAAYTASYMEAADMNYVNFIDGYTDPAVLNYFSQYDNIKGGVWSVGNYYKEGEGAVYWSNDKPFVCVRECLWRTPGSDNDNKYYGFIERVAQRINEYTIDPTSIEGYTIVVAHAWSIGTMDYISRFVELLDDDVEVVTVGELLDLVSKNVKHVDDEYLDDIQPTDISVLAPISSEQYRWSNIKNTQATEERLFEFRSADSLSGWNTGTGGLEYDFAGWSSSSRDSSPCIKLDGSDLDDHLDSMPNSWVYAMFDFSTDNDKDNYMLIYACTSETSDVNYRVRAIYEENGVVKSKVLISENYISDVDNDGYYLLDVNSPLSFLYDIREFKGKKTIISIEQDDTGDGSGEIVFINRIKIYGIFSDISSMSNWSSDDLYYDWTAFGRVIKHSEGLCLENVGEEASITNKVHVTESTKYLKIYFRKFVRPNDPQDKDPQIKVYINGTPINDVNGLNVVSSLNDMYKGFCYDLSNYIGETVTIKITNISGEHACFNRVILDSSYNDYDFVS